MANKRSSKPQVPYSDPRGRTRKPSPTETKASTQTPAVPESDYGYVMGDMRRIALLAILIFAAQFVLKFWMG